MKIFDIVLLIMFGAAAFSGYKKGLLMELVSLVALILGVALGLKYMHWVAALLESQFELDFVYLPYVSFLLTFVLLVTGIHLLGRLLKKILHFTFLGFFDSILGAALSVVKWFFIVGFVFWLSFTSGINFPSAWTEGSMFFPSLQKYAPWMMEVLAVLIPKGKEVLDAIRSFLHR